MKKGGAFFEKLIEKMFCGRSGNATCRPSHSVAAWLGAMAFFGSALPALSEPPRDPEPGSRARWVDPGRRFHMPNAFSLGK